MDIYPQHTNIAQKESNDFIADVSISYLIDEAKEEERHNRQNIMTNFNAPIEKIKPYENKAFLKLIEVISKEFN